MYLNFELQITNLKLFYINIIFLFIDVGRAVSENKEVVSKHLITITTCILCCTKAVKFHYANTI